MYEEIPVTFFLRHYSVGKPRDVKGGGLMNVPQGYLFTAHEAAGGMQYAQRVLGDGGREFYEL